MNHDKYISLDNMVNSARELYDNKRYNESIIYYEKAYEFGVNQDILDNIEKSYILSELGYANFYSKNYTNTIEIFHKVLLLNENFDNKPVVYKMLGTAYYYIEDYKNSIKYRELAKSIILTTQPDEVGIIHELGCSYLYNQNYKKAEREFEEFLTYKVSNPIKYYSIYFLGITKISLGKYKESENLFKSIIQQLDDINILLKAYYGLARLYYEIDNYVELKNNIEILLKISTDFSDIERIYFYQILCYVFDKNFDKVKELMISFKTRYPNSIYLEELNNKFN